MSGSGAMMPNDGDLLADWIPDPATREAVLTVNAQRRYGFPPQRA